jgi:hypothetical protein
MIASAAAGSGNINARLFFDLSFGSDHIPLPRSSSLHRMPATSARLAAVKINNWMTLP